jgi:hypothetical protein
MAKTGEFVNPDLCKRLERSPKRRFRFIVGPRVV